MSADPVVVAAVDIVISTHAGCCVHVPENIEDFFPLLGTSAFFPVCSSLRSHPLKSLPKVAFSALACYNFVRLRLWPGTTSESLLPRVDCCKMRHWSDFSDRSQVLMTWRISATFSMPTLRIFGVKMVTARSTG